jgi:cation transport ATPase
MTASARPGFAPTKETYIAGFTLVAIALHVALKYVLQFPALTYNLPLFAALLAGGIPMVWQLLKKLVKRQFGSDLLAGVSIITAILLGEYLVAAIVVLMLSGGEALEEFATARASSVLEALARRVPSIAHRKEAAGLVEVKLSDICIGDELTVLPHEICPVDGTVLEGHGEMNEAYLTGEPYEVSKAPGSTAPALMAATVGVAFGSQNDITTEAAGAVVLETSLGKIDELIHIGRRMRRIALQSALGGMAVSMLGMVAAAFGFLPPIWGAIGQELIDLFAVLNPVRVALPTEDLRDY